MLSEQLASIIKIVSGESSKVLSGYWMRVHWNTIQYYYSKARGSKVLSGYWVRVLQCTLIQYSKVLSKAPNAGRIPIRSQQQPFLLLAPPPLEPSSTFAASLLATERESTRSETS